MTRVIILMAGIVQITVPALNFDTEWFAEHFEPHPGTKERRHDAYSNPGKPDKMKVYCKLCLQEDRLKQRRLEEEQFPQGVIERYSTPEELTLICESV